MRIEVAANSPEWLAQRHGCCTASNLHRVVGRLKKASNGRKAGDYRETRDAYKREVIAERLSDLAMEHFVTPFMDQGLANEPTARKAYEAAFGVKANTIYGFALHPEQDYFGASLDATVGEDGGCEFKCFKPDKHLEIWQTDTIPEENIPQILGEIACYELKWLDWVSYCGFGHWPAKLKLFRKRITREDYLEYNGVTQSVDSHVADIEKEAKIFLEDVILDLGKLAEIAARPIVTELVAG